MRGEPFRAGMTDWCGQHLLSSSITSVRNPSSVRPSVLILDLEVETSIVLQQNWGRSAFSVGKGPTLEGLGVGMEVVMVWEATS